MRKLVVFTAIMVLIGFAVMIVGVIMMSTNSILPMVIGHNTGIILAQWPHSWTIRVGNGVLYRVFGSYCDSSLEAGLPLMCFQPPDYLCLYSPKLDSKPIRVLRAPSSEWYVYSVVDDPWWFEYYWNHSAAMSYWRRDFSIIRPDALDVVRLTPTS